MLIDSSYAFIKETIKMHCKKFGDFIIEVILHYKSFKYTKNNSFVLRVVT